MLFRHHYTGDYVKRVHNSAFYITDRDYSLVKDYSTIDEIPSPDKEIFKEMLDEGQMIRNSGCHIYSIDPFTSSME